MIRAGVVASLLVALVVASPARAVPTAESGDRVRATLIARPQPVVGTLLSYRPESLTIAAEPDSAESTFSRPSIKRLEISEGLHSSAGKGALVGGILGFVTLGALGVIAVGDEYDSPGKWYWVGPVYGAVGGIVGAGVGAAVGSTLKHERWERVPVPR